jgi:hypothetical protein
VADTTKNKDQGTSTEGKTKKQNLVSGSNSLEPIEYFYLETPNVPAEYFPLNTYGIYDRVTVESEKL